MARLLKVWTSEDEKCAYLPGQKARLQYRFMTDVTVDELDELLEKGWRRFGPAYFQPVCSACSSCVSLRIPAQQYEMSRNQKRVFVRNLKRFAVSVQRPQVDQTRLELYRRWHQDRENTRDWTPDVLGAEEYYFQFAFPHAAVREFAFYDKSEGQSKLVAVSIVDVTRTGLSSIYTYHDPDYRKFSLGTFSILYQLAYARRTMRDWVYLGYRVEGCASSAYKSRYQPHELLYPPNDPAAAQGWVPGE